MSTEVARRIHEDGLLKLEAYRQKWIGKQFRLRSVGPKTFAFDAGGDIIGTVVQATVADDRVWVRFDDDGVARTILAHPGAISDASVVAADAASAAQDDVEDGNASKAKRKGK